jgi:hypothetical protein
MVHPASLPDILLDRASSAKDTKCAFTVPTPGLELVGFLRQHEKNSAVYYTADGIVVPRMLWTAEADHHPNSLSTVATRTGDLLAAGLALENEQEVATLRYLAVAAQRDILGMSENDIADRFAYNLDDQGEPTRKEPERSVRRAAERGRQKWSKLGAWPWWCCRPPSPLPQDWWSEPAISEALARWVG